jgi:hypothetical protein
MRPWFSRIRKDATRAKPAPKASLGLESLEARLLLATLLHQDDLNYLGAFNVPHGDNGSSTFEYGGTALTFNPARNSLLMVGHDWQQAVAELSIPAIKTGRVNQLATADVLQPLTPILPRIPQNPLDDVVKIGGLMVVGDQLVGTAYEYYDAGVAAIDSHFKLSSLNLRNADVSGLYQVGTFGGGFVGGYMTNVPLQWQDELGTAHLTGQAGLSIISRTSSGPSAFGFDPERLGEPVTPATPLVEYPLAHPLAPQTTQNLLFNTTTEIRGIVFPEGTDSVIFIGSHGTGPYWYGEPYAEGSDPYRPDKGPHAPDYVYQAWAYDVHDLIAVKRGQLQPWQVRPYDTWQFDLPYFEGGKHIGGVAYDAASGRLYVSQQYGNGGYPVVHAYQIVVNVPNRNDAPILNTAQQPVLATIGQGDDHPTGTKVASLLQGAVLDPDGSTLRGIAVTSASNTYGSWQFTLDGGASWRAMGATSESAARLLPGWARVRFVPQDSFTGAVQLYYRAWDRTQGSPGGSFDVAGHTGGATAFSNGKESAKLTVTSSSAAPSIVLSGTIGYIHDHAAIVLAPGAVVSAAQSTPLTGGQLRVKITPDTSTGNQLSIGSGFSVDPAGYVRHNGTIIGKRISSGWGGSDLVVTFNQYATRSIVQQLVRVISFKTVGGSIGERKVHFSLTAGDGKVSAIATKIVNVV